MRQTLRSLEEKKSVLIHNRGLRLGQAGANESVNGVSFQSMNVLRNPPEVMPNTFTQHVRQNGLPALIRLAEVTKLNYHVETPTARYTTHGVLKDTQLCRSLDVLVGSEHVVCGLRAATSVNVRILMKYSTQRLCATVMNIPQHVVHVYLPLVNCARLHNTSEVRGH